ncbi:hypothetical protein QYE76_070211 [Lolium multiflorum]|uniref:Retrotransposon gag domain-containing protein n=1 Tax=Lolium multiflorum TaxID=4521 RepID=A0AAD8SJ68_LOLMU|nr:hypothetical protein QYE76_070211 [Lolium multiflorum]
MAVGATYQWVSVGIDGFPDEDVYAANWDDGELDGVGFSRNPALIRRDDRQISGVKDTPHSDGVVETSHGGTLPVPASRRRRPHGGRQLSLPNRWYLGGGILTRGEEVSRGDKHRTRRGAVDMKTDVKRAVKLDMELDMKISWTREEREECARGEEVGPVEPVDRPAGPGPLAVDRRKPATNRRKFIENKNSADIVTWREYEALRNEMRREFRTKDDELKDTVDEIKQTLDATNITVTGLADQMTDMRLAIENLTTQQQQDDDEDPELEDDAHNARGAPRDHRSRGRAPLGRNGRGQDEEDGLGKPKFSIPKFEGGADVEEYLTWELKIEKLWSLHPNYSEDKKIKLASSEFDGYALRWWDSLIRNRDEDGAQPIRTWRAMKEVMTSRFVPTNYMRNIFDKLTLLRQGVKTVDEYYMEMEMLMQRGRVRESLEMTMQRFLNGLKYDVKGIVRHYTYTDMNQLLHHAREAESQLAEEAKRALNVLPSASTQRCNLFQTKALVGPDKACKVIIDGGSCRNLASKELCTKLKLKYLPHPHPYYIRWLSDNGEMKVNHMEFGDVFPEEVPAGLPPLRESGGMGWNRSAPGARSRVRFGKGTERSGSPKGNIPQICGTDSSGRIGGIARNGSLMPN